MQCPPIQRSIVIADDAQLAAQVSCALVQPGAYLPVIDGPRLTRPDGASEVITRNNAVARSKAAAVVFAGLSKESQNALAEYISGHRTIRVSSTAELARLPANGKARSGQQIVWGRDRIGIGLLKALRARSQIVFNDSASPPHNVTAKSSHLVICEQGEELSEVIAANYAYALRAGLQLIPPIPDDMADQILENFYGIYDDRSVALTVKLEALKRELRKLCGPIAIPVGGSLTFVTGRLPFGFAFPEVPSTHLFKYPDLGIAVLNGFVAEQPGTPGVRVGVLVDPETDAPEIAVAKERLRERNIFVRGYTGPAANVRNIAQMVELYPYDLLIIAAHCGDASGQRWTYRFVDSEGIDRTLIVDVTFGIGHPNKDGLFNVTEFMTFVSLDGVDWRDPDKASKVYIGRAIVDFDEMALKRKELEPVEKLEVARVVGSAALKMHDHNYIAVPQALACLGYPIIINNACVSWHRLAETFTSCNARTYIGTLFPVVSMEAHAITLGLLGKHYGKPLAQALWSTQRATFGGSLRRPYVITGIYPQSLRSVRMNVPRYIAAKLAKGLTNWTRELSNTDREDKNRIIAMKEHVAFYERELQALHATWGDSL
jgi:hypothetical protein